jgi:hypothetical protein
MGGPTPIYNPLGQAQRNFYRGFHVCTNQGSLPIKEASRNFLINNELKIN